jgi:hypothetical protein
MLDAKNVAILLGITAACLSNNMVYFVWRSANMWYCSLCAVQC